VDLGSPKGELACCNAAVAPPAHKVQSNFPLASLQLPWGVAFGLLPVRGGTLLAGGLAQPTSGVSRSTQDSTSSNPQELGRERENFLQGLIRPLQGERERIEDMD
jgi:hypothetical protein